MNNLIINTCSLDKVLIRANKIISSQQKRIVALTGISVLIGVYSIKNTLTYKREIYHLKSEIENLKNAGENDEV